MSGRTSTRSFEEATEGEEVERKERLKTKWAQIEAVVGTPKRLKLIARDIVDHFEAAIGCDGREGDGCLHESSDLRRSLQRTGDAEARMA